MSESNGVVARRFAGLVRGSGSKARRKPVVKADPLRVWAYTGVGLTLGLSGWLNGMAFAQSAPEPGFGWALGVAVPASVLVFSRVAALLYARGRKQLAYAGAVAVLSVLLLSVQHCAVSIARLTGEPVLLAGLMALAIDAGLVVCELATVGKK